MFGKTFGVAAVFVAAIVVGCGEDEPEPTPPPTPGGATEPAPPPTTFDDVKQQTAEAAEAAQKYAEQQKRVALAAARSKLDALEARWADLKDQASDATAAEWRALSQGVGEQIDQLDQNISRLNVADVTVDDVKSTTADGLASLSDRLDQAADWLRKPKAPTVTVPPAGAAPATRPAGADDEPEK